MILPGVLAIIVPVIIGLWSVKLLEDYLLGLLSTGVLMAIMMANAGGAWDNGKKQIESGYKGRQKVLTDIRQQLLEIQWRSIQRYFWTFIKYLN